MIYCIRAFQGHQEGNMDFMHSGITNVGELFHPIHEGYFAHQRRMASSEMLRRVALVRTDVSEELSTSFIRMTKICELGTMLAVTSNRRTLKQWMPLVNT
jgi:hypothetical protein